MGETESIQDGKENGLCERLLAKSGQQSNNNPIKVAGPSDLVPSFAKGSQDGWFRSV